ncbi:hypothetical protein TRFO_02192 [Tritrichomonas foetus]|uniref:Uncharacterized protein n=1 Tax=Tritrichomonas foetus TaxID=1144522 RepID=A0A1J4JAG8_9EUKA|nr:hypothetical protein TRFO_02192 [Tritrichomonas foetus]|eukprot:OHS95223.1 hypothetical protein TRFO_02192 [Tritrichomonas foetus]
MVKRFVHLLWIKKYSVCKTFKMVECNIKNDWKLLISLLICFASSITILILTIVVGKTPNFDSSESKIYLINASEESNQSLNGEENYIQELVKIIDASIDNLEIMGRVFKFNFTLDNVYNALERASQRKVNIRIITTTRTSNSTFINLTNVKVRYFPWVLSSMNMLSTDMILNDNASFMISASIYDYSRFNKTNVLGFLFQSSPKIREDAIRYFNVAWLSLDELDKKTLPPYTRFWKSNLHAISNIHNPIIFHHENAYKVFIAQSPSEFQAPERDLTVTATKNIIDNAKVHIFIYATVFYLENGDFTVHNSLISAANLGIPISILISKRSNYNSSIQQAAMIASFPNIDVRVCSDDFGVPDLLIVDETLAFVSGPVTGPLFGESLGLEVFIENADLVNNIQNMLRKQWDNATLFNDSSVINCAFNQ